MSRDHYVAIRRKDSAHDRVGNKRFRIFHGRSALIRHVSAFIYQLWPSAEEHADKQREKVTTNKLLVSYRFTFIADTVNALTADLVKDRLSRRMPDINPGAGMVGPGAALGGGLTGKNLIRTLTSSCGLQDVRSLAVQKLEIWLQNPKLARLAQVLLLLLLATPNRFSFVFRNTLTFLQTISNSSVVKCPPLNWKVACSMHSHCVTRRSAHWARALTSTTPARSKFRDSACRQLPSLKLTKKKKDKAYFFQAIVHSNHV